jgi:hypothetical protein
MISRLMRRSKKSSAGLDNATPRRSSSRPSVHVELISHGIDLKPTPGKNLLSRNQRSKGELPKSKTGPWETGELVTADFPRDEMLKQFSRKLADVFVKP